MRKRETKQWAESFFGVGAIGFDDKVRTGSQVIGRIGVDGSNNVVVTLKWR